MKNKLSEITMLIFLVANLGMSEYIKKDNAVYYFNESKKIEEADVNSFEVLGETESYAKDKNNVYFWGKIIANADVKTFKIISEDINGYSKDKNNVYIGIQKIEGADSKTFEKIKDTLYYFKDKNNLYYRGTKIDEIKNNVKIMTAGIIDIVKNGDKFYANGEKIDIEDPETFEIIKNDYYANPNKIYAKDSKNIYTIVSIGEKTFSKVIKGVDKNTFEIMENTLYSKDKKNIYFIGNDVIQIKEADKNTFTIVEDFFSYDKNNVYFMGKKINGISSEKFRVIDIISDFITIETFFLLADSKNLYKFIYTVDYETYEIKSTKLIVVENIKVDTPSFESIKKTFTGNYYRDKNSVFYYEEFGKNKLRKIEGADRNSFVDIGNYFAVDNKNIYYLGKKIENISSEGFKEFNQSIIKNKDNVYFLKTDVTIKDGIVPEAIPLKFDSKSFDKVGEENNQYFKDKNGIYYFDYHNLTDVSVENVNSFFYKIEGADISTFKGLDYGYSKDKNKVYCKNKELKGVDVKSFEVISTNDGVVVKDKNRNYEVDCE